MHSPCELLINIIELIFIKDVKENHQQHKFRLQFLYYILAIAIYSSFPYGAEFSASLWYCIELIL